MASIDVSLHLYEYCNLVHSKRCHSSAPFLVIRVADTGIQEF
ncbi:MAG: hypothetical protein ACEY3L_07810 [Wolbachia sp.]|nr:hypothetical protein [Wolbachia endosymbiont (group A) of Tiphia femorata]